MDLEKLKAEHPDLVQAIRNESMAEGAAQERARIQAIEDIATPGHEDLVREAKFTTGLSAEALAVAILKADKARAANVLEQRRQDAEPLNEVGATGNEGLPPKAEKTEQEKAEMAAVIAAGARGFARK